MSVQNPERLATKQDLKDFYDRIRPYMGGLVTSKAGFTPIGTIISVMGTTAPVNYLACDGTVYNIADYTELANYFNEQFGSKNFFGGDGTTTFAVPDLRGEFLRGTGTNSHTNQGSGGDVGEHQDATENISLSNWDTTRLLVELKYPAESNKTNNSIKNKDYSITDTTLSDKKGRSYVDIGGQYVSSTSMKSEARYTSRPTNTSVLYCIATKNFYIDPSHDYSTSEKVIGTWIDGRPVFQRTFTFTTPSTEDTTYVLGVSGVEAVLNFDGFIAFGDGTLQCISSYDLDEKRGVTLHTQTDSTKTYYGDIRTMFDGAILVSKSVTLTVRYIKFAS